MQSESQQGQSLAEEAASGIRSGSSLSDAVEMQSALNANQLQLQQDSTRMQQKNALQNVLNNSVSGMYSIQEGRMQNNNLRDNAAYLRESYSEGGSMWNIYKQQKAMLWDEKTAKLKLIGKRQGQVTGWASHWKALTAMASGGAAGFNSGYDFTTKLTN